MKFALLGPTYPFRGGIAHTTTLFYHKLSQSYEVVFFSFLRQYPKILFPGKTDRDPSRKAIDAPCHYTLDSINPVTWLQTARKITRTGARWLILPWWVPFWALPFFVVTALVRRQGMKILYLCHNIAPHEASIADRLLTRLALSQGDAFIVQSPRDKTLLEALFPRRQVHHSPIFSVFEIPDLDLMPKETARRKLGIPNNQPVLLFFGFVRRYKGLHFLIEAVAELHQTGTHKPHLLIVGEFWKDKATYLDRIDRLGIAHAVTIIDRYVSNEELPLYFSAAEGVVLPYLETSQSAVIPLTYGFGKPVITTKQAGLVDALNERDRQWLVPPADSAALARSIEQFLARPVSLPEADASAQPQADAWKGLMQTIETIVAHTNIRR